MTIWAFGALGRGTELDVGGTGRNLRRGVVPSAVPGNTHLVSTADIAWSASVARPDATSAPTMPQIRAAVRS